MTGIDYWKECVSLAADDCGADLTEEQLVHIAESVQGGYENYGQAFYSPPSDYDHEIDRLKKELEIERAKVVCPKCVGRGRIVENFGTRSSNTECWICRGEGRVKR